MPRRRFNFWIDADLRDGLRAVRERDGVVDSEQVRRAVKEWLKKRGIGGPLRGARRAQRHHVRQDARQWS
jgi:hypothetical protein